MSTKVMALSAALLALLFGCCPLAAHSDWVRLQVESSTCFSGERSFVSLDSPDHDGTKDGFRIVECPPGQHCFKVHCRAMRTYSEWNSHPALKSSVKPVWHHFVRKGCSLPNDRFACDECAAADHLVACEHCADGHLCNGAAAKALPGICCVLLVAFAMVLCLWAFL